ncbi:protein-L-isoaspartate O-methyltransferase [Kitasatospora sp. MAA4]|uniref:methyltransferase domain-containing protein n=1 Tax=Kitasatospora sp. MAA4 TaxID=3035093 RepID=UPI00247371FE|nr:methyltransferase domain-containing protein [Kitasatospora sp. MAA4]MDH6134497.1 protein-L-isoaspartate O-methyltransferase [Kitasatospora sp. MAA4]
MTTIQNQPEQAATRGLLQAVSDTLGHAVAPEWVEAAHATPRHQFLPERIWLNDGNDTYIPCELQEDPSEWFAAAYANAPVVTQVNDGKEPEDGGVWPSSSASAPSIVFQMLEALDVQDGMTALEIGTGTGWNCALLSHRLGDANVVSIEVDPQVTARARTNLTNAGLSPEVVCGDGAKGWGLKAPYDRVLFTCSVRRVPHAVIKQTKPGGIILTPWDNPWMTWGLLRLAIGENNTAEGRFSPHSAFMTMRQQRTDLRIYRDVVSEDHVPDQSESTLPRRSVVGGDAGFTVGLRLGDVWNTWQDAPIEGVHDRLWLATTDGTSWAAVDHDGGGEDKFAVYQHGPRRLWDEVDAAYGWWVENGRPGPDRFGLTVATDGSHRVWLDRPTNAWTI